MRSTRWLAAFGVAGAIACGGGDGGSGPAKSVEVSGRIERSSEVTLSLLVGGEASDMSTATVVLDPVSGATVLAPDRIKLLSAGPLKITITDDKGRKATRTIEVAVPPMVVYDLDRGGNRDIWKIALDGLDSVRLTTHAADDQQPTAAGDKLVFVSYRDGNAELYTRALSGTASETRVTNSTANETEPALSFDGLKLAYTSDVTSYSRVWSATAAGTGATQVSVTFSEPGAIESTPAWRADNRLSFVSSTNGTADVYTNDETGSPALEVGGASADVEPAWSKVGMKLVFASTRDGDAELYVRTSAGGEPTRLTTRAGDDGRPSWTADGRIVFIAWEAGVPKLKWVDPDAPTVLHDINVGTGTLKYASAVR